MPKTIKILAVFLAAVASVPSFAAFRGGVATASNSSTQTVTVSGIGIQANDIILCALMDYIGNTPTWPSGFAEVPGTASEPNDGNDGLYVYYKIATASEPSSYSVTGVSFGGSFACVDIYNRNTTTPFTANSPTSNGTAASFPLSFSINGLTPASGDDVVEFVGESLSGGSTAATLNFTPDAAFANTVFANDTVDANSAWIAYSDKLNTSGATGTIGGSLAVTSGASPGKSGYLAQVISVAAAASGICTNTAYTSSGGKSVPIAGSTSVWLKYLGKFGTTPCDGTGSSWYSLPGGTWQTK